MRVLLDTNVLIGLYTQQPPEGDIAQKLLVMKEFGDVELWVSAKSFTDVSYVLHKTYSSDYVQSAFEESYQWKSAPSTALTFTERRAGDGLISKTAWLTCAPRR